MGKDEMQEYIKKMIDDVVDREVKNVLYTSEFELTSYIENRIEEIITENFNDGIKKKVDDFVDKNIKEELKVEFEKPIVIKDGWGSVEKTYDSFEELFKHRFAVKLDGDWRMKDLIKDRIDYEIKRFLKTKGDEVAEKAIEITNELLTEELTQKNKKKEELEQ